MRVHAQVQRPADSLGIAIVANSLADGQDVGLVEGALGGTAAVAGRTEGMPVRACRRGDEVPRLILRCRWLNFDSGR